MRALSPELQARLAAPVAHWTLCWRIQRRDGIIVGLTAHDRSLIIDGVEYLAQPSFEPSAISLSAGLEATDMNLRGALSSGFMREEDLRAGRFDGATIAVFMVDWREPETGSIDLFMGRFGSVQHGPDGFSVDCQSVRALLAKPVCGQFSVECRAAFGDHDCRVPLLRHTHLAQVAAAASNDAVTLDTLPFAAADYGYGTLRWLTGRNAGVRQEILSVAGSTVVLRDTAAYLPAAGDRCSLTRGCDKRFSTCRDRFANIGNFRGEPHVPGTDSILAYPGL